RLPPILERELREAQIRRERRMAQQALSESELRLRNLAESAPDAILIADAAGQLLFANGAAGRLFAPPASALIGRPRAAFLPDESLRRHAAPGVPVPAIGQDASGRPVGLEVVFGELYRDGRRLETVFARRREEGVPPELLNLRQSEEVFRRAAMMAAD